MGHNVVMKFTAARKLSVGNQRLSALFKNTVTIWDAWVACAFLGRKKLCSQWHTNTVHCCHWCKHWPSIWPYVKTMSRL